MPSRATLLESDPPAGAQDEPTTVEAKPRRGSRKPLQYSKIETMSNGEAITTNGFQNRCSTTTKRVPAMAAGHPTHLNNTKTVA